MLILFVMLLLRFVSLFCYSSRGVFDRIVLVFLAIFAVVGLVCFRGFDFLSGTGTHLGCCNLNALRFLARLDFPLLRSLRKRSRLAVLWSQCLQL